MKAFAIVVSGLLLATPAWAQASDQGAPPADAQAPENAASPRTRDGEERRICRRVETNTGSRVPFRRLCLTEREWEAYRRQQ